MMKTMSTEKEKCTETRVESGALDDAR